MRLTMDYINCISIEIDVNFRLTRMVDADAKLFCWRNLFSPRASRGDTPYNVPLIETAHQISSSQNRLLS